MDQAKISECCFLSVPREGIRLIWEVTQYCPFSCEYCFTWSSPRREKFEADINLVIQRIHELIERINVKEVLLTGGEPLSVSGKIAPFLEYLGEQSIPFSISTTLYNKAHFAVVRQFHPKSINLSIDPPTQVKVGSSFKADFNKLEAKLKIVEAAGLKAKLTAVISKRNYIGVPALLDFLSKAAEKYRSVEKIAFNREYPIGFAAESNPQTKAELEETFAIISDWSESEGLRVPVSLVNWSEFNAPLQRCPAGRNIVSVQQNADVTPCSLLYNITRSFLAGNLLRDPVDVIAKRLEIFTRELSTYYKRTEQNTPPCATCKFRNVCGGGCLAMLPIASNHIPQRTCKKAPKRIKDHERSIISDFHREYHEIYSPDLREFVAPRERLAETVEKHIRAYVKKKLVPSDLAHTMEHVDSVVILAKLISEAEGASLKITVPAAYFHDAASREAAMHHMHTIKSAVLAREYLQKSGLFTPEEITHIQYCIITSSYGSYLLGYRPLSLEAKVVRDADWLDAIGARGVARVFAFEQAHGAKEMGYPDYDPEKLSIAVDMNITGPDSSPIYHFRTKLLKIYQLLETGAAKKLGEERHQFMIEFLKQYQNETNLVKPKSNQLVMEFPALASNQENNNH